MRRVLSLLALVAGTLVADQVVLRDGKVLETKKPPVVRGRQAVLVLSDGKLVSIPTAEIDTEKTAALAAKAAAANAGEKGTGSAGEKAASTTAPTLVDAARASTTSRKAAVVLTDQDVSGAILETTEEKSRAPGRVSVSNISAKKSGSGTTVTGSVQNVGESPIEGLAVTVEAVGAEGQTVESAFGQLSADALAAGEKATFTAQLGADAVAQNVRVVPRWTEPARAAGASDAAGAGETGSAAKPPAAETPPPTPVPTRAAAPTPPPRPPDVAAPPANAPVGAPAAPGGTYLPPPASGQPKPPDGG